MKKLLFVLAFAFIGQQAFSQMYIVTYYISGGQHPSNCPDNVLTKIDPTGSATYTCITPQINHVGPSTLVTINQELNSIINQGYKLIYTSSTENTSGMTGTILDNGYVANSTIWYLAIPWSASGLEEVPVNSTTLKSFLISPNPANDFVDVSLDYSLKGESEVVFITEGGYMSYKKNIGEILKNEKYNIDISKIPAVKYLVTIVNGKTYTTPKKLIVI